MTSLHFDRLDIEALPDGVAARTDVTELRLRLLPNLRSARGLESLVNLESLTLVDLPMVDLDDLFTRAARLPALTSLSLGADLARRLPESIARLQGLLKITLYSAPALDFDSLFTRLAMLSGLRIVHLHAGHKEGVVELPPSIAKLTQIRELSIEGSCARIPPAITSLSQLEIFRIASPTHRRSRVKVIPADIGKLTALRELHLRGHAVKEIPASLCELRELRTLDLFGSPIAVLPERFGDLINLEDLDLNYCDKLTALPESFGNLRALRAFHAGRTGITSLPSGFGALRLQQCELPNELLAQVKLAPPDVLYVDELMVERPYDTALPDDLGDPITLTIDVPHLSEPAVGLSKLRRLETIRFLPAAPAFDLGDAFHKLAGAERLRSMGLHGWKMTSLPATIGELTALTRLGLSDNLLETLPDEIGALESLQDLVLDGNPITHFPDVTLPALEELSFAEAPFETLPRGIGRFTSLKKLVLWKLKAKSLSSELASLSRLEEIKMQSSEVADFEVLGALASLRTLDLTWVRSGFDAAALFRALARTKIESLTLQYTLLATLPPEIGGLTHLRFLDVRSTEVTAFPPETANMTALRRILFHDFRIPTAAIKPVLPKGRWRKTGSGDSCCYLRVDEP